MTQATMNKGMRDFRKQQPAEMDWGHCNCSRSVVFFLILCAFVLAGCDAPRIESGGAPELQASTQLKSMKIFVDVTDAAGLSFVHKDGPSGSYEIPRAIGSGCGWIDANGDHRLDILVIDGGQEVDPGNTGMLAALYLQTEDGRFRNFSTEAGFIGTGYGMGLAIGDIDNDNDQDVYLTKYGPDQLFLNDGTGHFTDVTRQAGIENLYWSTAVAMTDLNQDGWLDLVVANYVDYFPGTFCGDAAGRQEFGGPVDFQGTPNRVFMNLGRSTDGTVRFEDHSAQTGLAAVLSKSLGLVCRDFDEDGDTDIFVANDAEANQLWIQNADSFIDEAYLRGVAVNRFGEPEGNMGTVIGDFTGDLHSDLLVTHLSGEMNTLWQGDSNGFFSDETSHFQLGKAGLAQTGFGIVAVDVDCNGRLDILVANGKVNRDLHRLASGTGFWADYAERNQIFLEDAGDFLEVNDGAFTELPEVWRAVATGDYDRDGDPDLLVTSIGRPARLYRNDAEKKGHWLCVLPFDAARQRFAYGAAVTLIAENHSWTVEILPHTSFLSSHEPMAHFGIGDVTTISSIEVIWPEDAMMVEEFTAPEVDRRIELVRGNGIRRRTRALEKTP